MIVTAQAPVSHHITSITICLIILIKSPRVDVDDIQKEFGSIGPRIAAEAGLEHVRVRASFAYHIRIDSDVKIFNIRNPVVPGVGIVGEF